MPKTTTTLTPDQAAADLEKARHRREELRQRIIAGEPLTPADLLEAQGAEALAELRVETAERLTAEQREQHRLNRVEELRSRVTEGSLRTSAEQMIAAYDAAEVALSALDKAAGEHESELRSIIRELRTLGPLPETIEVTNTGLYVDGVHWTNEPKLGEHLATQAADSVLGKPHRSLLIDRVRATLTTQPDPDAVPPSQRGMVQVRFLEPHPKRGEVRPMRETQARWMVARYLDLEIVGEEQPRPARSLVATPRTTPQQG